MSSTANILYPSVTSLPGQSGVGAAEKREIRKPEGVPSEFDQVLDRLDQVRQPLKFSAHANQRLTDRNIRLDASTMARVNDAIDKAAQKGVEDTLVLTGDAALIVNVPNRTVVTAMDRNNLSGNVFTNIDGAVII